MKQSENIVELLSALAEIQNELPTMPKSTQAYGYKYTDLDTITQTIKPILYKHNVGYLQSVGSEGGATTLTTRVFNSKGEWIEDTAILPSITNTKNNAAQVLGMSITYMRRYMLCAMLGITSDEDVDASTVQQQQQQPKNNQQSQQKSKPQLKGGEGTKEENARIRELLSAKYENGSPIFTKDEMKTYGEYRYGKFTAKELIEFIENALKNRYANAKELANKEEKATQEEFPIY